MTDSTSMLPLDQLMSMDPLELSNEQLDQVIAHMREARAQWLDKEVKGPKSKSKTSKSSKEPTAKTKLSREVLEELLGGTLKL